MDADDLVIRFNVWGPGDARLIASQLPQAEVLPPTAAQQDTDERTVEARLLGEVASSQFVRLRNEGRPVVFSSEQGRPAARRVHYCVHARRPRQATGPGIRLTDDAVAKEVQVGILDNLTAQGWLFPRPVSLHRPCTTTSGAWRTTGPGIRLTDDAVAIEVQVGDPGRRQPKAGYFRYRNSGQGRSGGDIVIGPDPLADGLGKQLGDVNTQLDAVNTLQTHNHPHNHP